MSSRRIAILTVCAATTLVTDAYRFIDKQVLFHKMCDELAEDPDFNIDRSVDLWVQDFTWNTHEVPYDLLGFRKVTPKEIARFKKDMGKLVITEPVWDAAQLVMIDQQGSRTERQTLLIPMGSTPGRYIGVQNMRAAFPLEHIRRKSVQLVRFQMLMVAKGSFLIIMECDTGETTLLHRDTLKEVPAVLVYSAAAMVPFPVRYSHLYTGVKIPEIAKEATFEPLFLANHESFRPSYVSNTPQIGNFFFKL